MILKELTLHNFGVYAGTNTFRFSGEKPIVLIGGMNGRGKTTFLEAILIALYGPNSIVYTESKYPSYNKYLRSLVNKDNWTQSSYVELEFFMNDETNDIFLVRREWDALSKITKEHIFVSKNGVEDSFLTQNWAMFVENILPCALSSFYFFDGEKIAELAIDDTNKQMKDSIRSMLGITVLDVLENDLERCIRKIHNMGKHQESDAAVEVVRKERDTAISDLEKIDRSIEMLTLRLGETNTSIEQLREEYEAKGGAVFEKRQEMLQNRAAIQTAISTNKEELVSIAATELPLVLVKDLIGEIKLQAEDEYDDFIMEQALEQMDTYLAAFSDYRKSSVEESQSFIEFIKLKSQEEKVERIYELSNHALFQTNTLYETSLDNAIKNARVKLGEKHALKKQLDDLDSYLSLDINENEIGTIYNRICEQQEVLVQLQVELASLQQKRSTVNANVIAKTAEFKRVVEDYLQSVEMRDDSDRMLKYANIAVQITEAYRVELQKRKTGDLGRTITKCYKRLANKKKLIQEIVMDPETLDMKYLDEDGNEVLKESLSAGEKQLMVIAILWALAICSKKKLPVIIDTPLSRLDSQHRTSIITSYFPNASEQTIILSTDTEIDRNYYDMISAYVGDEFTLEYNEASKSTTIRKGYFLTNDY